MRLSIIQRKLTNLEIAALVNETQQFPDIIYISPNHWRQFTNPYCLSIDNHFAGICAIYSHKEWIKIGPLILLRHYHGKGLGKKLLQHVIQDNKNKSLFITSSNPAVQKIVESYGFQKISSIFSMPINIVLFLAVQSTDYIHVRLLLEWIRKILYFHRGARKYYIKK